MEKSSDARLNGIRALRLRLCWPLVQIFHAGTKRDGSEVKTAGGRVLAVTALGSVLEAARARAYEAMSRIYFENCHYRRDIALDAVAANVTERL